MTHDDSGQIAAVANGTAAGAKAESQPAFVGRVLTALALASLFATAGLLLVFASDVLLLAFAGLLLATFLRGLARIVSRRTGLKEGWSLAIVMVVLAVSVGLAAWFLASTAGSQFAKLSTSLEKSVSDLEKQAKASSWGGWLLQGTSARQIATERFDIGGRISGAFSKTLDSLANAAVILFVGGYVAIDPGLYRRGLIHLLPKARRTRTGEVLDELDRKLGRWLVGQFFIMTVVGVGTGLGLWMLGIPLVVALAFLAFLFDFVPYVGPIAAAVPAVLLALTISPAKALAVASFYVVLQSVESYLLTPLVQKRAVELPPAVTILSQLLMGLFAGILGLALATPLTTALITIVRKLYVEDVLGDAGAKPADRKSGAAEPAAVDGRDAKHAT